MFRLDSLRAECSFALHKKGTKLGINTSIFYILFVPKYAWIALDIFLKNKYVYIFFLVTKGIFYRKCNGSNRSDYKLNRIQYLFIRIKINLVGIRRTKTNFPIEVFKQTKRYLLKGSFG